MSLSESSFSLDRLRHPGIRQDPYPFYRWLRESETPVFWDASGQRWVVTRHRDVVAALRDPALSAVRLWAGPDADPQERRVVELLRAQMLFADPPDHTRLRRLVSRTFTPRMIDRLRPAVTTFVDGLLDRVCGQGRMDVVRDLAMPLPVTVIAEMLGVPPRDRGLLAGWSLSFAVLLDDAVLTPEQSRNAVAGLAAFAAYLSDLAALRRREPREDLVSELVAGGGEHLSHDELLANLVLLLAAGHFTTTHLLGNGILALLRHPGQWRLLCREPSLAPSAVQELLRYDPPVQFTERVVARPTTLGGRPVRTGDPVVLLLGAANRDPEVFPDPGRLDLRRSGAQHVAFGHGIHTCLGMALARMEAETALTRLAARLPGLRLAPGTVPEREEGATFRGLRRLEVCWPGGPEDGGTA
jgi:cytochrome P450